MEVSPELDVTEVNLQQLSDCDWKLTWQEDLPLKHRRVMLRSAWQPWQPVIEQRIPDENRGEYTFTDLSLPPSRYEVYFYIRRSWENPLTIPPEDGTCLQIDLCAPEERLLALNKVQQGHNAAFRNCIESACILDSIGQTESRDEAVSGAATHLIHLKDVRTLVGSIKWMQSIAIDAAIKSFFRKFMFRQDLVKAILGKYPAGDENLTEYLHMITTDIYADSAKLLLEKVDDPHVISNCVKALLLRSDEDLSRLVVLMLQQGRLSFDDAADLLTNDPAHRSWALENIGNLERSISTDSLMTAMLPNCLEEGAQTYPAWLQDALLRAVKLEKSPELRHRYLEILIKADHAEVWQELLELEKLERTKRQEFYELLKLDPKKAFQILMTDREPSRYAEMIQKLEEEFPQAAGVLESGMVLLTPFGQAQIVSIRLSDGVAAQKAHLSDGNFILNVVSGTGLDRVEVALNFISMTLLFKNTNTIYRCGTCKAFSHPRQARLNDHYRQSHPFTPQAFQIMKGSIPFMLNEIKYANQPN